MRTPLLLVALCALAAPLAAQQTDYRFELDPQQSAIAWSISSSLGAINVSPATFQMAGTAEVRLDAPTAPTSGQILDGLVLSVPSTLTGTIPNPLPFLPPLGTITVNGLQAALEAPSFAISGSAFTMAPTLTSTAGTMTLGGLFGSGTEPVFGIPSNPSTISGTLTQNGSTLELFIDLDLMLTVDLGSGITADVTLDGPLYAYADTADANPMTVSAPRPLSAGQSSAFQVRHAPAGQPIFLGGTVFGLGSFNVPQLGIVAGLANPVQAAGPIVADANGNATLNANVPASILGRSVWVQAVTFGEVSNVAGTWVE
jgi:hypothetical protein